MDCEKYPFLARLELLENLQRDESKKHAAFEKETRAEISLLKQSSAETRVQYQNIVGLLQQQQRQMEKQFDKISADIEELKQKPAQRWDGAMSSVVTAIIGAVMGYAGTKIFGG